ncbi:diguanylate cyclase domain-containing protein [Pseudomonadota bacterium]
MTNEAAEAQPKILIVDDSKVIRWAAAKILDKDHAILEACNGQEGWDILQSDENIGLIFSDLQMPEMDGYELLEKIRSSDDPRLMNMPVVVITSQDDDDSAREKIMERGATDFISKPFDSLTLKSRASAYLSYGKQVAELEEQVEHDKLTGLANKRFFYAHGEKALALASRHETNLTIALIEIEHFGKIIEKFGKNVAAQVIIKVGKHIPVDLRKEDLAARIETARFALVLPMTNRIGCLRAVARLCNEISALNLKAGGEAIPLNVSAGISSADEQKDVEFTTIADQALEALATASSAGGNSIVNAAEGVPHQLDEITTEFIEAQEEEATPEAAPEEAPSEAAPEATSEGISIDQSLQKIAAGEGDQIPSEQLADLLRAIMPLIEHASAQLNLGLEESLKAAASQLEEPTETE